VARHDRSSLRLTRPLLPNRGCYLFIYLYTSLYSANDCATASSVSSFFCAPSAESLLNDNKVRVPRTAPIAVILVRLMPYAHGLRGTWEPDSVVQPMSRQHEA